MFRVFRPLALRKTASSHARSDSRHRCRHAIHASGWNRYRAQTMRAASWMGQSPRRTCSSSCTIARRTSASFHRRRLRATRWRAARTAASPAPQSVRGSRMSIPSGARQPEPRAFAGAARPSLQGEAFAAKEVKAPQHDPHREPGARPRTQSTPIAARSRFDSADTREGLGPARHRGQVEDAWPVRD